MPLFPIVRTLTAPIPMPNINKTEVVDFDDRRDNIDNPRISITLHFRGVGNRDAGTRTAVARDATNSTVLALNGAPGGYGDVILDGAAQIDGACTSLATAYDTAYDAASGNRNAKKTAAIQAAVTQAQTIGLIGAGLATT